MKDIRKQLSEKVLMTLLFLHLPMVFSLSSFLLPTPQGGGRSSATVGTLCAQEITVTVTPVQQILPPQAFLYIDNPGAYFNITLINSGSETANIYLGLELNQVTPSSDLSIIVPAKRQPTQPLVVPAGRSRQLTLVEMKTLFNHVPSGEIKASPGLFDSYNNGSFGLLPEGVYQAHLVAYQWNPVLANPVPVSNPAAGICNFTICYNAQSPQFLTPFTNLNDDLAVAKLPKLMPQFTWRAPLVACNPSAVTFQYDFRMVELLPNQQPDVAIKNNPVFYSIDKLMVPMVTIPFPYVQRMDKEKTYVAQVTARASGISANQLNYVKIENDGKSNLMLVKLTEEKVSMPDIAANDEEEEEEEEDHEPGDADDEFSFNWGKEGQGDSLYNFRRPSIIFPTFPKDVARKVYIGEDIDVEWRRVQFVGGEGEMEDTLQFSYTVNLYKGSDANREEVMKTKPIFTYNTKDLETTIKWDDIKGSVASNDYLLLCIEPECKNQKSIGYDKDDDENITDFAIVEHLSKKYFQCASVSVLGDMTPTKMSEKEILASSDAFFIGDYRIKFKELKKNKGKDSYTGTGHIVWSPGGYTVNVAVKFDDICINDAGIVYEGTAVTYQKEADAKMSNSAVVDELFSEWGVDNLIGDTNIPFSDKLQEQATSGIKSVAEKLDISTYYQYIKKGNAVVDQFMRGDIDDLHLPLELPKSINKTPCDIQIVSMKFGATQATMDVLAEFTLPESKYLKNEILMLGAPRLCISPSKVLPESGTFALLGDFTVVDPDSKFEFTFNAPKDVLEPIDGTFISWSEGTLELLDIDVSMKIPQLKKVGKDGKATNENPKLNFHASISTWDDWFAECSMDEFTTDDLKGWSFQPGKNIIYDHSVFRSGKGMGKFPEEYNKVEAGMSSAGAPDTEWQGLYVGELKVVFPGMLEISDKNKIDNPDVEARDDGSFCIAAKDMFIDGAGGKGKAAVSCRVGLANIFDISTGKLGGWGISMDEIMLVITQNSFKKAYFKGEIQTPLEGIIGYQCDIYAQGKDANGVTDPNRSAYIFKTQQVEGLNFDFWLATMDFDHDQTYFLVEAERFNDDASKNTTKVELSIGGALSIDIAEKALKKIGVPSKMTAYLPKIKVSGLRLANCERWKSNYTQNQYENPAKCGGSFFGWKEEYTIKNDEFYFSLGRWSLSLGGGGGKKQAWVPMEPERSTLWGDERWLAQEEDMGHGPNPMVTYIDATQAINAGDDEGNAGKLSAFDFSVTEFDADYKGNQLTLTVTGEITLMGGALSAGCTLDLPVEVNIEKMSFKAKKPKFNEAYFDSSFGCVIFAGKLAAIDTDDDDGYKGEIKLHVGSLFQLDIEGLYAKHTDENGKKISWGYFESKVSGEGIHFDPVVLKGIEGGFYINCNIDKEYQKSCYGGKFGLTVACTGDAIVGNMSLTFIYDAENKCVSAITLVGSVEAMMGMVKGDAKIAYQEKKKEKTFELDVTVTATSDMEAVVKNAIEEKLGSFNAAYKQALDKIKELPGGSLADMGKDEETEKGNGKKASNNGSEKQHIGGASFKVNFNFKVTKPESGKVLWHAYFGRPNNRCEYTHIDFLIGSKDVGGFGAWCYMGVNGYLCLGNELPEEGIPDPPKEVMDYLFGDKNEGNLESGVSGKSEINDSHDIVAQAFKKANESGGGGGFMFGLHGKADFGVNAGIVYCNGLLMAGLDLMIKKYPPGTHCQGGGSMGKDGWYGLGQMYVMVQGEIGVQIKLWFFEGRCSLVDAGFGALLQGGAPNPSWAYGKVKAHCNLLGGMYKFKKSVEMKAGRVCVPDYGDPLDDIKMFESCEPGTEDDTKYSEEADPDMWPKFVTNFTMDTQTRLMDEGKGHERSYMFKMLKADIICDDDHKYDQKNLTWTTKDHVSFSLKCKPLEPEKKYHIYLKGQAFEWDTEKKEWANPEIRGERTEKIDEANYYFKTGELPKSISNEIMLSNVGTKETGWRARLIDVQGPYLSLSRNRDDLLRDYDYMWIVFKDGQIAGFNNAYANNTSSSTIWNANTTGYPRFEPNYNFNPLTSLFEAGQKHKYRIALYRFDKGKAYKELLGLMKTEFAEDVEKTVEAKKMANSNQQGVSANAKKMTGEYFGATSDPSAEMNAFFAKEEKEKTIDTATEENSEKMEEDTYATFETGVLDWYTDVTEIWDSQDKFCDQNGFMVSSVNMPYDRVFFSFDDIIYNNYKLQNRFAKLTFADGGWDKTFADYNMAENSGVQWYQGSPYWAMAYLTKFVFLGGVPLDKYKVKAGELTGTFNNLANPSGPTIKLAYPERRTGDVSYPTIDGLYCALTNSANTNYDAAPSKPTATANYMKFAEVYAQSVPYTMGWQGHAFNQPLYNTKSEIESSGLWGTDDMELQDWERTVKYINDMRVFSEYRQTTIGDAVGIYRMCNTINSQAKLYYDTFDKLDYFDEKKWKKKSLLEQAETQASIALWINNSAGTDYLSYSNGAVGYSITANTTNTSTQYANVLSYEGLNKALIANQMIEAGLIYNMSVSYKNYNSDYRKAFGENPSNAWWIMTKWKFNWRQFLDNVGSVTYKAWRAMYYDYNEHQYRLDKEFMDDQHVKTMKIVQPFQHVTVNESQP